MNKRQKELLDRLETEYGMPPRKKEADLTGPKRYCDYLERQLGRVGIDAITWNDLDMERIFTRIDYTGCSSGTEVLYEMLRHPEYCREKLDEREKLIRALSEKQINTTLGAAFRAIGTTGKYTLTDHLEYLEQAIRENPWKHILVDLLFLPVIALLFYRPIWSTALLFLLFVIQVTGYFKHRAKRTPYLISFGYILRMMSSAEKISGLKLDPIEKDQKRLREILNRLEGFKRGSFLVLNMNQQISGSGPLDLILDYVKMIFHIDLIKWDSMLAQVQDNKDEILRMMRIIGNLDACRSIALYRASLPYWCEPQLIGGAVEDFHEEEASAEKKVTASLKIRAEELVHPLLTAPVPNSIEADGGVLITGSNATGKSTFLKSVALASLFSQTICTVTAKSYEAPFVRLYTSMALRDDVTSGDSYFMAEIKALKRIVDAAGSGNARKLQSENAGKHDMIPVLCLVDEVLRGTNTVERIAASTQILRQLRKQNVFCFAATHDVELTGLLSEEYENYHFEEQLCDGQIAFDYKLGKGRAASKNAIRLLESVGYDKSVTEAAFALAQHFSDTGSWN